MYEIQRQTESTIEGCDSWEGLRYVKIARVCVVNWTCGLSVLNWVTRRKALNRNGPESCLVMVC